MLRHLTPVAFLAFTMALSILPAKPAWSKPVIEVVFVLDTTGSMGPLIEGAKRKIWSIATTLIDCSPDAEIRMGLVAYRDIGDDYVTKTYDLTTDIQGLYADLLQLRARGGGDWPESVNEALFVGITKMSWSRGRDSTRIIFLVGDAPPHMDYAQDMKYPDVMRLARARDITINTVQAGSTRDTERTWREIAQMGRGEYMSIPQDGGKIVVIETPYDREIIELQNRINRTVVPYGSPTQQRATRARVEQYSSAAPSVASDMAGYMAKRAARPGRVAEAVTGEGDLVGDVASGRRSLASLPDSELPDDLRRMPPAERQARIEQRMSERRTLNEQLADLVSRRDRHIADARSKAPPPAADSFDRAVERTLRSQIAR
ncbi:MAG: VWA domain-containing protein [Rhizobiales bacterium]|nr:VWA domain-containing protein [Hyphomicrobiales bacterium]